MAADGQRAEVTARKEGSGGLPPACVQKCGWFGQCRGLFYLFAFCKEVFASLVVFLGTSPHV
jgi:hypothetical protein